MITTTTTAGTKRTTTDVIPSLKPTETELVHFTNKKELAYAAYIASQVAVD